MSIEKWNPFSELEKMRQDMDTLWGELFPTPRRVVSGTPWRRLSSEQGIAIPAVDIIDNNNEILVRAEMPGVDKDHIDITVQEDTLTIKGEVEEDGTYKSDDYYHRERAHCVFARTVALPMKVDADKIRAGLKDGILNVHLPKIEEDKPRKIKVTTE